MERDQEDYMKDFCVPENMRHEGDDMTNTYASLHVWEEIQTTLRTEVCPCQYGRKSSRHEEASVSLSIWEEIYTTT
jgi:hypothetical protein